MPVNIIDADIEKDIDIFLNLLNQNRQHKAEKSRFEWLYLKNPQGKARAWIVIDEKTQEPIAFTSVLPRMVIVNGKEIICWNCCDFSVNKRFRTLGVAVKLRLKAKECVENKNIRALYAHPNDKMKLIHEKAGHLCIGEMRRYVKLLRADRQIHRLIKNPFFSKTLSLCANFLLRTADGFHKIDRQYPVEILKNEFFGKEYDDLFYEISKYYTITGDRTQGYLNWRYAINPLYQTERITIRKNGKLAGYIIYLIEDNIAVVKDILCVPDKKILKTLLGQFIKLMRKKNIDSISAGIMDKNPVIEQLKKTGFKLRPEEKSSVYAYAKKGDIIEPVWSQGTNWYMTVGDRDV
ncbi:acyl-transferase domain-containing protein [Desulfonema limicola]|uniref:Acyl-transferase domain-containing protein n=1 Tax=Desulfonema limicola TaxID=45656 RepID=A0A975B5F4_9BACT|nr:hypothetical protein [Desulfonema limicola]QTA79102.1 acyl-transferase domain-containing protein [Desulfonema limicola]